MSISTHRLEICNDCPFFLKDISTCSQCGCNMQIRTRIASSDCPIGKWGSIIGEDEDYSQFIPPPPPVQGWARIDRKTLIVVNVEIADDDYIESLKNDPDFMFVKSPDAQENGATIGCHFDTDRMEFLND